MDLAAHVDAVRAALATVAGDDEASSAVAERLAAALAPALHLQLLDMLGEVAVDVTGQLPAGRLDLQLSGRDALLVYHDEPGAPAPVAAFDEEPGTARLTLRMAESLKNAVERAAAADGLSTNSWLVAAARQALEPTGRRRRPGNRLTGYTQA